jgi:hypothetical protein
VNDYSPELYELIEGTHPSGYTIEPSSNELWTILLDGSVVRTDRTSEQAIEDANRYLRLTDALA